jgi:phosphohistidine phosphatase
MRHANPAGKQAGMSDHDRPLDERGRHDAECAAGFIVGERVLPDLTLSSTAVRARQTAEAIGEACGRSDSQMMLHELYLADLEQWLGQLRALPDDYDTVMLVGHNPGLEGLIETLTGERVLLCTAALARLDVPVESWSDLGRRAKAALVQLWQP